MPILQNIKTLFQVCDLKNSWHSRILIMVFYIHSTWQRSFTIWHKFLNTNRFFQSLTWHFLEQYLITKHLWQGFSCIGVLARQLWQTSSMWFGIGSPSLVRCFISLCSSCNAELSSINDICLLSSSNYQAWMLHHFTISVLSSSNYQMLMRLREKVLFTHTVALLQLMEKLKKNDTFLILHPLVLIIV